jgi:hypothetical protein
MIVVVQQHKSHCMVTAEWMCEWNVIHWWLKLFDSTAQSIAYNQFYPQTFHIIKCLRFYTVILISVGLHSDFHFQTDQSCTNGMSRHMNVCNETNMMHYLFSVYWVTTPLHVSGLPVAHHQEVAMYMCDSWYVLYVLVDVEV